MRDTSKASAGKGKKRGKNPIVYTENSCGICIRIYIPFGWESMQRSTVILEKMCNTKTHTVRKIKKSF